MTTTLVDHLRGLPDDQLGALFTLRPDLATPVPADIVALATRAQGRISVARALDGLDRLTLEIIDALRLIRGDQPTASVPAVFPLAAEAGAKPDHVNRAVDALRARCLVFGPDDMVRMAPALDDLLSAYPAGLGRPAAELDPAAAELAADPARLRRTLLSAPPEARAVLDRLAGPLPVGAVRGPLRTGPTTGPTTGAADTAVRWSVEHHLLVAIGDGLVELPREVGLLLRRDTGPLGALHPEPPAVAALPRPGADQAGAGQALEAVRHLDALLHALAVAPAPVLRSGGLGVRDLRRIARETGVAETVAVLLLEIGYSAGLVAVADTPSRGVTAVWLPTTAFDGWRREPSAAQWATLARAWLTTTRAPALVAERDERDRPITALSPDAERLAAPAIRRAVLAVLADLPSGSGADPEAVLDRLAWLVPRRLGRPETPTGNFAVARATLIEAAHLGVTGLGALTGFGRELLADPDRADDDPLGIHAVADAPRDPMLAMLTAVMPASVDHVVVQADLTVVVPGPPDADLAAQLALVADAESRGGASVYRITEQSLRRALAAGLAGEDIHDLLRQRSRTPLPQGLTYLIDDMARRHGGLRVGTAGAYLRCDDETLLAEVIADRRLTVLGLRRLAPTVLATAAGPNRMLDMLRDAGYSPVLEDATGAAVLTRPTVLRAPAAPPVRPGHPAEAGRGGLGGPRLAAIVEQVRIGDRLARSSRRALANRAQPGLVATSVGPDSPHQPHTEMLAVLRDAVRTRARIWIGYVNSQAETVSRLVRPMTISAGYLRAEDERGETLHTFALHRITSARAEK